MVGRELYLDGLTDRFDLIIPVPLHHNKMKRRGYNQSESFAIGLSEGLNTKTHPLLLQRIRNTPSQTRKPRLQRWRNVDGAFRTTEGLMPNQKILIVDDIVTTGATLEACGPSPGS